MTLTYNDKEGFDADVREVCQALYEERVCRLENILLATCPHKWQFAQYRPSLNKKGASLNYRCKICGAEKWVYAKDWDDNQKAIGMAFATEIGVEEE